MSLEAVCTIAFLSVLLGVTFIFLLHTIADAQATLIERDAARARVRELEKILSKFDGDQDGFVGGRPKFGRRIEPPV